MPVVPGIPADTATGVDAMSTATNDYSVVQYIGAWGLVLLMALLLNRTKWGHALIYYGLALALLLLLVGNYKAIAGLLAPASQGVTGTPSNIPPTPPLQFANPPLIGPTSPITASAPQFEISV